MANDLQDRLHDLADRTPPAVPPADLWTRGVRRRRVGHAVTSLTVVVIVRRLRDVVPGLSEQLVSP